MGSTHLDASHPDDGEELAHEEGGQETEEGSSSQGTKVREEAAEETKGVVKADGLVLSCPC